MDGLFPCGEFPISIKMSSLCKNDKGEKLRCDRAHMHLFGQFMHKHPSTKPHRDTEPAAAAVGGVLLCFSGVCQLNSWCHQTPGPTATLNESLRNGQLCSGQETPLKNYHFVPSTRPLPLFQTCQHCNQRQAWPPATQCCSLPPLPSPPSISQH